MDAGVGDFSQYLWKPIGQRGPSRDSHEEKKAKALAHAQHCLKVDERIRTQGLTNSDWPLTGDAELCTRNVCPAEIKMATNYKRDLEGFFRVLARLDNVMRNYTEPDASKHNTHGGLGLGYSGAQRASPDPTTWYTHMDRMANVDYAVDDNLPRIVKALANYEDEQQQQQQQQQQQPEQEQSSP